MSEMTNRTEESSEAMRIAPNLTAISSLSPEEILAGIYYACIHDQCASGSIAGMVMDRVDGGTGMDPISAMTHKIKAKAAMDRRIKDIPITMRVKGSKTGRGKPAVKKSSGKPRGPHRELHPIVLLVAVCVLKMSVTKALEKCGWWSTNPRGVRYVQTRYRNAATDMLKTTLSEICDLVPASFSASDRRRM